MRALAGPPATQASNSGAPQPAARRWAARIVSGCTVEWTRMAGPPPASSASPPGPPRLLSASPSGLPSTPSASPPGPSNTWSRCSAAGTQTLTASLTSATSAGLTAAAAPKATAASTAAGSTSYTVTSAPVPIRFSAMAEPIMPSPMYP